MVLNIFISSKEVQAADVELVFDGEPFLESEATQLEELAVLAGIFPSKGRARKNGFSGPIPHGLECLGTKKKWLWVWNPNQSEEPTVKDGFVKTNKFFGGN